MSKPESSQKSNTLKKIFLWLVIGDYLLLGYFFLNANKILLNNKIFISSLLFFYNFLLVALFFQQKKYQLSHIIYPIIFATILVFFSFIYSFFLV